MATINFAVRQISVKVVYFGATGAGCTTNVEQLHDSVDRSRRSQLHGFGPSETEERSWFFQYATAGAIEGFELLVRTYSLPGGIDSLAHRDEVARDADAVVLIADARADRNPANVEALMGLEQILQRHGRQLAMLPAAIQVNHTDAAGARSVSDVVFDLNPLGFPVFEAVASEGRGVLETHQAMLDAIRVRVRNAVTGQLPALPLTAIHDPRTPDDLDLVRAHMQRIRDGAASPEVAVVRQAPRAVEDGPEIEVPFQPRELVGSHPIEVVAAALDPGGRVRVDLVMEHMGGGSARRLTVWLVNRPTDAGHVIQRLPAPAPPAPDPVPEPALPSPPPEEEFDYPPLWYGGVGVVGGIAIGALGVYLLELFR